jgi:hypothetical protein
MGGCEGREERGGGGGGELKLHLTMATIDA